MKLTHKTAKILLVLIITARATSFCFSKICLTEMSTFSLLGIRFTLAFLLLLLIFHRNSRKMFSDFERKDILKGCLLGILYYCVMVCEYTGLKTTSTSAASFIENMAIIIVPFLHAAILRRLPAMKDVFCAFLAMLGIGLLISGKNGFVLSTGEIFLFGAALFYASAILAAASLSRKGNSLTMGIFQVGTIGILGLLSSGFSGEFTLPHSPAAFAAIGILAVVCTGFGYTLQPVVQSKLSAEETSLFCAVNPLTAGFIGAVFLNENPTPLNVLGECLIIAVLVLHSCRFRIPCRVSILHPLK